MFTPIPSGKNVRISCTLGYKTLSGKRGRVQLSTGVKVPASFWKDGRVKRSYASYLELNAQLEDFAQQAKEALNSIVADGNRPTAKLIRQKMDEGRIRHLSFVGMIRKYAEKDSSVRKRQFNELATLIEKFSKHSPISPQGFEASTIARFVFFLEQEGYASNSITRHVGRLKEFANHAYQIGAIGSLSFQTYKYKAKAKKKIGFSLYAEELAAIVRLNLTGRRQIVRDMFVFQCYTAMRLGDVRRISASWLEEDREGNIFLTYTQEKSKSTVSVVLFGVGESIAKYYLSINSDKKHLFFGDRNALAQGSYNNQLKHIAREAGLDRQVAAYNSIGREQKDTAPLWQELASHAARRTFITLRASEGWSTYDISTYSGHRSIVQLERYIKRTQEFNRRTSLGIKDKYNL